MESGECYICATGAQRKIGPDQHLIICPRCGAYGITRNAIHSWQKTVDEHPENKRFVSNTSSWLLRNANTLIGTDTIRNIFLKLNPPNFHEQSNILLLELEKRTDFAGHYFKFDLDWPQWLSLCYCNNKGEFIELLKFLSEEGRIKEERAEKFGTYKITPKGWAYLEDLKKVRPDSLQGFVAMSFDPSMDDIYKQGLFPGIDDAGYKPYRVDAEEHLDKIDDRIIAQIRRSRFVVADFTGQKAGVYFEAGYALGLGIPVLWTCRRDEVEKLHFDIRQYNCIFWSSAAELREKLQYRIEANFGRGTK
jgi:hypothetical protein